MSGEFCIESNKLPKHRRCKQINCPVNGNTTCCGFYMVDGSWNDDAITHDEWGKPRDDPRMFMPRQSSIRYPLSEEKCLDCHHLGRGFGGGDEDLTTDEDDNDVYLCDGKVFPICPLWLKSLED